MVINVINGEKLDKAKVAIPGLTFAIIMACQWNSHIFRILTTKQPHVRIEGDKIIAFGKTFPKGTNNYLLFEKRPFKLGHWLTLRNGQEEMHIPLIFEQYVEEYKENAENDRV